MMDRAEIRETLDKADELVTELKAFRNLSPESGNVTQFTVNAGGVGVWIAATACLMMLVLNVILGFLYIDLRRESARVSDYQQTEYMLIPEIKKLVDAEMAKRKER